MVEDYLEKTLIVIKPKDLIIWLQNLTRIIEIDAIYPFQNSFSGIPLKKMCENLPDYQ